MKSFSVLLSVVYLITFDGAAFAYGVPTHKELSKAAVDKSALKVDPTILSNLGLKPPDDPTQKFLNSQRTERTIKELIEDGSDFEDNLPRFFHHFYDPVNNRALADPGIVGILTTRSPDWASEDHGEIDGQDDSFFDARKFLLGALRGQNEPDRRRLFGRTFQALGQVVHHLQDMAQPQHVRNEQHLLPPSLYERSSDAEAVLNSIRAGIYTDSYPKVNFDSARKFWVTREDGTVATGRGTGQGIAEFTVNNFVSAERNFRLSPAAPLDRPIEAADILPHDDYPRPNNDRASVLTRSVGDPEYGGIAIFVDPPLFRLLPNPLDGKISFIGTPITDTYYPSFNGFNSLTSTFSVYEEDLRHYHFSPPCDDPLNSGPCRSSAVFTLNEFNFEAARSYLLPRAIAYSAGLIDYFFRGKVEMCDGESSEYSIIKNLSQTEDMKGVFELYADDDTGVRTRLTQWKTTDLAMLPEEAHGVLAKNGGEMRVTFPPPDPKPDTYLLVFYGDLGEEKAPRDTEGNILPGGAVVAKQVETTIHCTGTLWVADQRSASVFAYHLPEGRALGSFSLPNVFGIAYDPRDGNLWYTSTAGNNTIRKVTPRGDPLPQAVTVSGMVRSYQGYEPRILGIDSDPKDPSYVWVATSRTFVTDSIASNYAYKVRTQDGPEGTLAGQVVQQCQLVKEFLFNTNTQLNSQVAVVRAGATTSLLVSPFAASVRQRLHKQQVGALDCPGIAAAEYFLTADFLASGAIAGVDTSSNEVIAVVRPIESANGTFIYGPQAVYHFGPVPTTSVLNTFPLPADILVSDLAVGSSF